MQLWNYVIVKEYKSVFLTYFCLLTNLKTKLYKAKVK